MGALGFGVEGLAAEAVERRWVAAVAAAMEVREREREKGEFGRHTREEKGEKMRTLDTVRWDFIGGLNRVWMGFCIWDLMGLENLDNYGMIYM